MNIPDDKIDELVGQIALAISESKHTIIYAIRVASCLDEVPAEIAFETRLRPIVRAVLDKYSQKP